MKTRILALALTVGLTLFIGYWFLTRVGSPDHEAVRLQAAIRKGDWDIIFNRSSPSERKTVGLTQEQFRKAMGLLSKGIEVSLASLEIRNCTTQSTNQVRVAYYVWAPGSTSTAADGIKKARPLLMARRIGREWLFDMSAWPCILPWLYPGRTDEQLLRFADVLEKCAIDQIICFDWGMATTPSRLRQAASGQLAIDELWTHPSTIGGT